MSGLNRYTVNDDTLKNQRREQIERGPGGDHDEPYKYQPFAESALRAILKTLSKVVKGAVGGAEDGDSDE
jgi:hypothetical protein